jgi:hypothetical protein
MNYFEQIAAMHQQVREYVEKMEPDYKVVTVDGYTTSEYRQDLASQGEIHPKYAHFILAEVQLRFKVSARHVTAYTGNISHRLICDVLVTSDGTLHTGDRLVSK